MAAVRSLTKSVICKELHYLNQRSEDSPVEVKCFAFQEVIWVVSINFDISASILHSFWNVTECVKNAIFNLMVLTCCLWYWSIDSPRETLGLWRQELDLTNPDGKFESPTDAVVCKHFYLHRLARWLPWPIVSGWQKSKPSLKRSWILT